MTTLYRGGRVLPSFAAGASWASALLVDGGRVAWVGDEAPDADETVELDGAVLLPAFADAHAHVTETGLLLDGLDLTRARSVPEILDLVAAAAARRPGRTVLGHGWDELLLHERRPPTLAELDRAAPGCGVYLARVDVHSAIVSGALAGRHGLAAEEGWTPDGRVERDAHHVARHATRHALPAGERRELQRLALRAAAAAGIAELHEMSAPHVAPEADLAALLELTREPGERLPAVVPYRGELVATAAEARERAGDLGVVGLAGDLVADGSVGSRTACFRDDYTDAPGVRGHLYLSAGEIEAHVVACTEAGVQAGFHVIGDAGVDAVVAGFEAAARRVDVTAGRHRLEHAEAVAPDAVLALARHRVAASVQPAFDAAWGGPDGMYATRLGAERAAAMNPFAAFAAAGVELLLGSDAPVTPFDPWGAVRACVHHRTPAHRIPAQVALAAHSPFALTPGAPATFAIWSAFPNVAAGEPTPDCLRTVRDGARIY